jgi:hypothetical protein
MESSPSPPPRDRLLVGVLIALALLYPLWNRMVDTSWDGLFGPRIVQVVERTSDPALERRPSIADQVSPPSVEPAAPVVSTPEPPAPISRESRAPEDENRQIAEAFRTPVPTPAPAPEVLGAYTGGTEPQVLVDLRGLDDPREVAEEICFQAQAFIDRPLSGERIRIQGHEDEQPSRDLGLLRCP